ncbi:E3 ubiquitin-protein ligase RNF123-like [Lingula anatina]|uniref:E3 ubiquitin-protein ligase RNF123-like n=1 Tax=Lingula anatina TaxID=7574 RepID=A0A2R2MRT8_LINAN|nr:E3 ubiquitin-protein ligase RNF123-like [Lingula anatina]|eukprot:XP_023932848.1 E3 ubiquitin-protein ligase RNF123-like [Lingula anatina]
MSLRLVLRTFDSMVSAAVTENLEEAGVKVLRKTQGAPNTRFIFLQKFKEFLKENMTSGRVHPVQQCPLPVILCLFHRMIRLLRSLWDDHASHAASRGLVSSDKAHVAEWCFADDSVTFVDIQRFGGVMSHLKKEHKELLQKCSEHRSRSDLHLPPTSLLELLDGTIMLFDIGAYKQLGKMATLHDTMKEYVLALQDTQSKIDRAAPEMTEVLAEVNHAKSVFLEKSAEQARQRAWLIAVVYSKEKQLDVQWIMETAMRTIENATVFFPFIPEYYIEVCINAYNALKHYFNPIQPFRALEHLDRINEEFARFLAKHFANNQIVNTVGWFMGVRREAATSALLNEPGFQMSSVEFLLGGTPGQATVSASDKRNFSLRKYQEVSPEEIKEVEEMISHLKKCQISRERKSSFSEGEECTICYAHSANCVFQPCKHVSCRSCISQHLMSHKECFFCKSTITKVLDNNGKVVPIKSGKS